MHTNQSDAGASDTALQDHFERGFEQGLILQRPPVTAEPGALEAYSAALREHIERNAFDASVRSGARNTQASRLINQLDAVSLRLIRLQSDGFRSSSYARGLRLAMGLHDNYPRAVNRLEPFESSFTLTTTVPKNTRDQTFGTAFTLPDLDVGRFYSSAYTTPVPYERAVAAYCSVRIPVPTNLHDATHGAQDIQVTAAGHVDFDYQLHCEPGQHWNGVNRPTAEGAAWIQVAVQAELIAYDRATGALLYGPGDTFKPFVSGRNIATIRLFPNGTNMTPSGQGERYFNGAHAGFIGATSTASLGSNNGVSRMLATDRIYAIAVSCFVTAHANVAVKADGTASIASANVSAMLNLSRVTFAIRPHEDGVI